MKGIETMNCEQKIDIKALLIERLNLALGPLRQGSEGYKRVWAIRQALVQLPEEDQVLIPEGSLYYFTKWAPTHGDQYNPVNISISDFKISGCQPVDDEKLCRYDAIMKVFAEQRPDTDEETRHKAFEAAWKVLGAATVKGVEEKCTIGVDGSYAPESTNKTLDPLDLKNFVKVLKEGQWVSIAEAEEEKEDIDLRREALSNAIESAESWLKNTNVSYAEDTNLLIKRAQSFYEFLKGDKHGN